MSRNAMTVEEERKIVRLSREGKSMTDISRELRRSKDSVHDALIRLGLNEDGMRTLTAAKIKIAYDKKRKKDPSLPEFKTLAPEIQVGLFDKTYAEVKRNADLYRDSIMNTTISLDSILTDLIEVRDQARNVLNNVDRLVAMIQEEFKK